MSGNTMSALIVSGGGEFHRPHEFSEMFATALTERGFAGRVDVVKTLDVYGDEPTLAGYDLIVPNWTLGEMPEVRCGTLQRVVRGGVGIAGIHGGMGDTFRGIGQYTTMVGGHFAGHPYVGQYQVRIVDSEHEITTDMPESFEYESEQYYMLVDPAIHVLADTEYRVEDTVCSMPVAWIKREGLGRVFYCSLGHAPEEYAARPHVLEMVVRGMVWAAKGSVNHKALKPEA